MEAETLAVIAVGYVITNERRKQEKEVNGRLRMVVNQISSRCQLHTSAYNDIIFPRRLRNIFTWMQRPLTTYLPTVTI